MLLPVRRCLNSRFSCFQFPFCFRNRCRPCQGVYRISMCSDSLTLTIDMRIINYIFIYLGTWACSCLGVVIGTRHGQRSGQASTIRCPSYRPRTARICFGMICVGEGIWYNFTNSWWNWSQILTSIGLDNALVFETSSRGSLRGVFDVKYFDYFGGRSRMAEM